MGFAMAKFVVMSEKLEVNIVDKAEYRVMLDRITALADAGDYTGALPIVEQIDWRRVKSIRTLCMVSEIYEANKRLEDSLRVLKLAYKRGSISKTVLYRLSETCAKLGDYKGAINYYKEFEDVSPMDNSKYILKYEIYRAKGSDLDEQIRVLEEYKDREYTEKWAYKLAQLYSEAGRINECVETCDDLILWFNEGSYVTKAMELKKKYVPLTPTQRKKYEEQTAYKAPEVPKWETQSIDFESQIIANTESVLKKKEEKPAAATYTVPNFEPAPVVEPVVQMDPSRMQNQLADSIRAVFSGINRETDELAPEEESQTFHPVETDMSDYEIKDLEPESVNGKIQQPEDTPNVMKQEKDRIEEQKMQAEPEKEEFDLEALIAETTSSLAQEVASGAFEMTDEMIAATETESEVQRVDESEILKSVEEAARMAAEEVARRIAEDEAAKKAAEEEAAQKAAEEEAAQKAAEEEALRKAVEEVARKAEEESQLYEKETDESLGLTREFNFHEELKKTVAQEAEANLTENDEENVQVEEIDLENLEALIQDSIEECEEAIESVEETEEMQEDLLEDTEPEEERLPFVPVEPREMTDKEKDIFSYFTKIPGMSQQITETISDVHNNAGDKTSKSGNFLIIGRQGSGKTKLYESMVLAICNDLGIKAAKMAKIIGRDLNKKDVAAVVAKMAGGFLVIEGAGELSDESVAKLSQAMEFRTDSLVVVLEDEKADLFEMLDRHPELSEKFTSSIKIPVFTNDELVTFAKTYANENGYKMDEMGVLALYTKIGDNQKNSEPVTVGKVKDIMDDAISHANKGTRKFGRKFSKNAVDEDNRVLLLEKDFE